jgi:asparagine synthase (glutamine-hydrolysing)
LRIIFQQFCSVKAKLSGNPRWAEMPILASTLTGSWLLSRGLYSVQEAAAVMGRSFAKSELFDFDFIFNANNKFSADSFLSISQLESSLYLRNQLLRDSDWASMAHSVELRTPLVDAHLLRRLAPFLSRFSNYPNKSLLSGSVRPGLPETVTRRAKTGFGIPMDSWLFHGPVSKANQSRLWAKKVVFDYEN